MDRREFMQAASAAAFARYDGKDYGPENIDEWGPIDWREIGKFDAGHIWGQADVPNAGLRFEESEAFPADGEVWYVEDGIYFAVGGRKGDRDLSVGLTYTPDQARELAAMLFQAAWEYEKRTDRN